MLFETGPSVDGVIERTTFDGESPASTSAALLLIECLTDGAYRFVLTEPEFPLLPHRVTVDAGASGVIFVDTKRDASAWASARHGFTSSVAAHHRGGDYQKHSRRVMLTGESFDAFEDGAELFG